VSFVEDLFSSTYTLWSIKKGCTKTPMFPGGLFFTIFLSMDAGVNDYIACYN